jgi:hypothetical protein
MAAAHVGQVIPRALATTRLTPAELGDGPGGEHPAATMSSAMNTLGEINQAIPINGNEAITLPTL